MTRGIEKAIVCCLAVIASLGMLAGDGCGGSSGGGGGGGGAALVSILLNGGDGAAGTGGAGGPFTLTASTGDLNLLRSGAPDTSFTVPAQPAANLGANGWIVTQNYFVELYQDVADANANAAVGEYLLLYNDTNLYRKDGVNNYAVVTGLQVNGGVSLIFSLSHDLMGQTGQELVSLHVSNDVVIAGRVTTESLADGDDFGTVTEITPNGPATERDMGALALQCDNLIVTGRIDLAGANGRVGEDGGAGGAIDFTADGDIYITGLIDCSGGSAGAANKAGTAGWVGNKKWGVRLNSTGGNVIVTGTLDVRGGNGGMGGDGDDIETYAPTGDVYLAGSLLMDGGDALDGWGGAGGDPTFGTGLTASAQNVYLAGKVSANGGDAMDASGAGPFPAGNSADSVISGVSSVVSKASFESRGGKGKTNCAGGSGGSLLIQNTDPTGVVRAKSRVILDGGDSQAAVAGGTGGSYEVQAGASAEVAGMVSALGGDGQTGGGPGGSMTVEAGQVTLSGYSGVVKTEGGDGDAGAPGGPVNMTANMNSEIQTSFTTVGGNGSAGPGAIGGNFNSAATNGDMTHVGSIITHGGDGTGFNGGTGGFALVTAGLDLRFRGAIDMSAGDPAGAGNIGGAFSGGLWMAAGLELLFDGAVYANGGSALGTGFGGGAGAINFNANHVEVRGPMQSIGGRADNALGTGGSGGAIKLNSTGTPTVYSGIWRAQGGQAATPGADGLIQVDGVQIWP